MFDAIGGDSCGPVGLPVVLLHAFTVLHHHTAGVARFTFEMAALKTFSTRTCGRTEVKPTTDDCRHMQGSGSLPLHQLSSLGEKKRETT